MKETLLRLAARRTPRYTSYPTAAQFTPGVGAGTQADWLATLPVDIGLSLYLHVPFCRQVCWYCACNMKLAARPEPLAAYATDLMREIDLVAGLTPARRVSHLHWGGGTPTALGTDRLGAVMDHIRAHFDITADAEIAVELDPRTFEPAMAPALAAMGVTRASLGVQEFDASVQAAVNRIQPFDTVAETVDRLRDAGIRAINFDLMYGLPHQTEATLARTIEQTVDLAPDRIALFGYAHVPWMARRQRKIDAGALPGPAARLDQAQAATEALVAVGYVPIGLDHFALPGDPMVAALDDDRLVRNFQGYTTDGAAALIGMGASAVSALPDGYAQNLTETGAWSRAVNAGHLPVARGVRLSVDDRLRRAVISALMCTMQVDLGAVCRRMGHREDALDSCLDRLDPLVLDGLVELRGRHVEVSDPARPVLRLAAAAFDAYLPEDTVVERHAATV